MKIVRGITPDEKKLMAGLKSASKGIEKLRKARHVKNLTHYTYRLKLIESQIADLCKDAEEGFATKNR